MTSKQDIIDQLRRQTAELVASSKSSSAALPEKSDQGSNCDGTDASCAFPVGESVSKSSECSNEPELCADDEDEAFRKIVRLVNFRERSELECVQRLTKDGFSMPVVEDALSRARELSIVDDRRFTEVLIRSRISQGKGPAGILRELRSHGIPDDLSRELMDRYECDDDHAYAHALEFLRRKPTRSKNAREAAYRKLVSHGYSSAVAARAARRWCEEKKQCYDK